MSVAQTPPASAASPLAEQIVTFATHDLSSTEQRLFSHYAQQLKLATDARAALWVLLFKPWQETVETDHAASAAVGGGVCTWGDGALRRALPRLARSIEVHAVRAKENDPNHMRYFWFTSSLLLWNRSYGHAYPKANFIWRIEPDVCFAGSWASLLSRFDVRVDSGRADVLLPKVTTHAEDPGYPHWERNDETLHDLPRSSWVYSLVSIGRYSRRFLEAMAKQWEAGTIGYEEIFLPTACVKLGPGACRLQSLHHSTVAQHHGGAHGEKSHRAL